MTPLVPGRRGLVETRVPAEGGGALAWGKLFIPGFALVAGVLRTRTRSFTVGSRTFMHVSLGCVVGPTNDATVR
jgi:hypothetical protein